jgi:hypothetical protein
VTVPAALKRKCQKIDESSKSSTSGLKIEVAECLVLQYIRMFSEANRTLMQVARERRKFKRSDQSSISSRGATGDWSAEQRVVNTATVLQIRAEFGSSVFASKIGVPICQNARKPHWRGQ